MVDLPCVRTSRRINVTPLPTAVSACDDNTDYARLPGVPLRQWVLKNLYMSPDLNQQREAILRKIAVAYAIGKLLEHLRIIVSRYSRDQLEDLCSVDNFVVYMSNSGASDAGVEVMGISMISPPISLELTSSLFSRSDFFESVHDEDLGRNVEAVITKHSSYCCSQTFPENETICERLLCYSFGLLLYFLFFGESLLNVTIKPEHQGNDAELDDVLLERSTPAKSACLPSKRRDAVARALSLSATHTGTNSRSHENHVKTNFHTYHSVASPHAVSQLVGDLLDCNREDGVFRWDDSYSSLEEAIDDMHLLLQEPKRYLFEDNNTCYQKEKLLTFANDKMYGRTLEASALTDSFCKVALSGRSEAFIIGGFSGSGKTRLVQSVFDSVLSAGGMVVNRKFDQTSNCPLAAVLSAFDDLCILIVDGKSEEQTHQVYQLLVAEFGTSFYLLAHILPNVLRLAPSPSTALSLDDDVLDEGEVNFYSLCDIIKRFMRVVSSSSCPVMLFLDDLQWADPVSLGVVHTILSDLRGASCLFFVGSYRDNEVKPTHIIFGFCDQLSAFEVPLTTIHLDGMPEEDTNLMISGALGMFPRLCRSLSQVVFRKTGGNPFFVQTFLRSLVDKRLLKYNLRGRSWVWDDTKINSENITPYVLDLVSAKMTKLSTNVQTALKIAACFGSKINVSIVQDLSKRLPHSSLLSDINEAVEDGVMDLDPDGSHYRFVHDKVREAAYGMISSDCKKQYHFDVGMALLSSCESRIHERSDILFTIIDQINHGVPSLLRCESQRISISKLNFEAGSKAMQSYNYTSAYTHAKAAILLLPHDSWKTHYELSLKLHFLFAKAAHPCKNLVEARDSLNKIIDHADCIETKLDAYTLLESILFSASAFKEMDQLSITIIGALESLGENIPDERTASQELTNEVSLAKKSFERESDDALFLFHESGPKTNCSIIHAYNILVRLAWSAKLKSYNFFVARWVRFCLKSKAASKYVPAAYATFASILCEDRSIQNLQLGYRIGKLSLKMLNQNKLATSELPLIYLMHYGHIAIVFEPIQACIDMHRQAYKIGLQCGKVLLAAFHKQFLVVREMLAGTNLLVVKKEIDLELKMASHHSFPILRKALAIHYTSVVTLIGDDSDGFSQQPDDISDVQLFEHDAAYLFSQMFVSTHLGFFERAKRLGERWESLCKSRTMLSNLRVSVISFYYGLALIAWQRKNKWKNVPNNIHSLLEVVMNAATCSAWNFKNKVSLFKAELFSFGCKNSEAEVEYNVAIKLAQASRFIHEEALAYELAGMHHERLKDTEKALAMFQEAIRCYKEWGSQRKPNQMADKIRKLHC